jgi:alkylhydroperoxidase family enzyme
VLALSPARQPGGISRAIQLRHYRFLKSHGLTDRIILDATLVVAYFNFVNRMVLGLGVNVDESEIGG